MPLFRGSLTYSVKNQVMKKRMTGWRDGENTKDSSSLCHLCLMSLTENMSSVWTRDYSENYMEQHPFRYVMGPFNILCGQLVEELLSLLFCRRLVTRAALHLLLLPQVRTLSLSACSSLVTPSICQIIGIRCQALLSLDLSGSQHISAPALADLLRHLPRLRALSLRGTQCNACVLQIVGCTCTVLEHLDVSCCHQLTPCSLLCLVKLPQSHPSLPLRSLVASDIGFGKGDYEQVGVAVFLLLALPGVIKLALEGLGEACIVIEKQDFGGLDHFMSKHGMPCLQEIWNQRMHGAEMEIELRSTEDIQDDGDEEEECLSENQDANEEDEDSKKGTGSQTGNCQGQGENLVELESLGESVGQRKEGVVNKRLTLCLREAEGVSCSSVLALGALCPNLCSLSLNCSDNIPAQLAVALERWKGTLLSFGLRFPGVLTECLPLVRAVGATLHRLTLEGIRMDGNMSFVQLIRLCPTLKALIIHTEPPVRNQEEEEQNEEEEQHNPELPCLSQLRLLSIKFFIDQHQRDHLMSWRSLQRTLVTLLAASPFLEKASLVAMPCCMDMVFQQLLENHTRAPETPPLHQLQYLSLAYCNVSMETTTKLVTCSKLLSTLDLTGCWAVSSNDIAQLQRTATKRKRVLTIIWS